MTKTEINNLEYVLNTIFQQKLYAFDRIMDNKRDRELIKIKPPIIKCKLNGDGMYYIKYEPVNDAETKKVEKYSEAVEQVRTKYRDEVNLYRKNLKSKMDEIKLAAIMNRLDDEEVKELIEEFKNDKHY